MTSMRGDGWMGRVQTSRRKGRKGMKLEKALQQTGHAVAHLPRTQEIGERTLEVTLVQTSPRMVYTFDLFVDGKRSWVGCQSILDGVVNYMREHLSDLLYVPEERRHTMFPLETLEWDTIAPEAVVYPHTPR